MVTRQMRTKVNNTVDKMAAMETDIGEKIERVRLEMAEASGEISEINTRAKKSKI